MRGSDISVYACSWMSGINVPVCSIQPGYWKLLGIATPHQSFLISGSEVPLIKKSSFPPGEAKNRNRELSPFTAPLSSMRGRADSIRPYGSSGEPAAIHPAALSHQLAGQTVWYAVRSVSKKARWTQVGTDGHRCTAGVVCV